MTDNEALAAGVALLPEFREDVAAMIAAPLEPQSAAYHRKTIQTIIAALEAANDET